MDINKLLQDGHVVKLQGKPYVTHAGLLTIAHAHGLQTVETDLVSWDAETRTAIIKATATGERGSFSDYGDASPSNVSKNLANATLRFASTRAINRALRLYNGIGMCSVDELPAQGAGDGGRSAKAAKVETKRLEDNRADFNKERPAFMATLSDMGLTYETVCAWLEGMDKERPSAISRKQRGELVAFLKRQSPEWRSNLTK